MYLTALARVKAGRGWLEQGKFLFQTEERRLTFTGLIAKIEHTAGNVFRFRGVGCRGILKPYTLPYVELVYRNQLRSERCDRVRYISQRGMKYPWLVLRIGNSAVFA